MIKQPEEYLKEAWIAVERGDLAERDRLCALSIKVQGEQERILTMRKNDPKTMH